MYSLIIGGASFKLKSIKHRLGLGSSFNLLFSKVRGFSDGLRSGDWLAQSNIIFFPFDEVKRFSTPQQLENLSLHTEFRSWADCFLCHTVAFPWEVNLGSWTSFRFQPGLHILAVNKGSASCDLAPVSSSSDGGLRYFPPCCFVEIVGDVTDCCFALCKFSSQLPQGFCH